MKLYEPLYITFISKDVITFSYLLSYFSITSRDNTVLFVDFWLDEAPEFDTLSGTALGLKG